MHWRAATFAVLLIAQAARADEPPAPLKCLARWYAITPVQADGRWFAALPDGSRIPDDDGVTKTFQQRLDSPDVKDLFSIRYRTGPIAPVVETDSDPGRIRIDAVFKATYGATRDQVDVVPIVFAGTKLRVNRKVAAAFQRVDRKLIAAELKDSSLRPFLTDLGGTFEWRNIAGTHRLSAHSFGVSVDLNPRLADFWGWSKKPHWANKVPQAIVDAFEQEGFIWGGRWSHYDTMHFEYRPELLDAECYPK